MVRLFLKDKEKDRKNKVSPISDIFPFDILTFESQAMRDRTSGCNVSRRVHFLADAAVLGRITRDVGVAVDAPL